ncbi:MAG: phosphatase PAP2 family protein [Prevotella sp.]|jgi:membrane-associated phospholipid phosphatase|nr:phosphatase PAP2 family protein [Prevotella sp.]
MKAKHLILMAKALSAIFSPFHLPVVGLVILFLFSYLSFLPLGVKIYILLMVYTFTILLPTAMIRLYRRYQGWTRIQLGVKERRVVPYVISIMCYLTCYYLLTINHASHFIGSIVMASLIIQVVCAIINLWWKISTHSAAIGGVTGALVAFAMIFNFNPVWWICLLLLLAGMVGTSRIILKQHTLEQVVAGYLVGIVCAFLSVVYV